MRTFLFFSVMSLFCLTVSAQNWVQLGNGINGIAANDFAGKSLGMSADGNTIAIGAANNSDGGNVAGQVRIFTYNGSSWVQKGRDIEGRR